MIPPVSGPLRGRAQGRAFVIRTQAGGSQEQRGRDHIPPVHVPLCLFGLFVLHRLDRTAPAERDKTGATPPFSPLARLGEWGGVTPGATSGATPPIATGGGRSRPHVSLLYGLLHLRKGFIHPGRVRSGAASLRVAGIALPPAAC